MSEDNKQVAIGCNDNSCSIWDISDRNSPSLKFVLPHKAAIKAIAYCPWSSGLLATGGGSKDRTIRFWHSHSGTLLKTFPTKGQITSLIWSPTKKQICASFGFTDSTKPTLVCVYGYPSMNLIAQANASPNLRALSCCLSADGNRICVSVNDETVRFYEVWSKKDKKIAVELEERGIFGSDLLELNAKVIAAPEGWR